MLLVVLSFGQSNVDALDTQESLFNLVALDMKVGMREWWVSFSSIRAAHRQNEAAMPAAMTMNSVTATTLSATTIHPSRSVRSGSVLLGSRIALPNCQPGS